MTPPRRWPSNSSSGNTSWAVVARRVTVVLVVVSVLVVVQVVVLVVEVVVVIVVDVVVIGVVDVIDIC